MMQIYIGTFYDKSINDTVRGKDSEYVHACTLPAQKLGRRLRDVLIPQVPNGVTIFTEIIGVEEVSADILRSRLPDGKI